METTVIVGVVSALVGGGIGFYAGYRYTLTKFLAGIIQAFGGKP